MDFDFGGIVSTDHRVHTLFMTCEDKVRHPTDHDNESTESLL